MGDAAGEGKKAPRNAAVNGDGATTRASVTPVEHHRPAPFPAAQSCGGREEDDDEQVERFYALLANIRALRGLYSAEESQLPPAADRGRKRAREAEAPWRPAFRMEDFEEEVSQLVTGDTGCAVKRKGTSSGAVGARRHAVARARAADDDHEEDDVADERKLRRRVAAQG
jgi:hypothetical protein